MRRWSLWRGRLHVGDGCWSGAAAATARTLTGQAEGSPLPSCSARCGRHPRVVRDRTHRPPGGGEHFVAGAVAVNCTRHVLLSGLKGPVAEEPGTAMWSGGAGIGRGRAAVRHARPASAAPAPGPVVASGPCWACWPTRCCPRPTQSRAYSTATCGPTGSRLAALSAVEQDMAGPHHTVGGGASTGGSGGGTRVSGPVAEHVGDTWSRSSSASARGRRDNGRPLPSGCSPDDPLI